MRLSRLVLTVGFLYACVTSPEVSGPRVQRLPSWVKLNGIGRIALDEPLATRGAVQTSDTEPSGLRILPRDAWLRLPLADGSEFWKAWVWVRSGTVGCVITYYKAGTDYSRVVAQYTHVLGPPLKEHKEISGWHRATVWADERTFWSVWGPQPGHVGIVSFYLGRRDPEQDPTDPSYLKPCSSVDPWARFRHPAPAPP